MIISSQEAQRSKWDEFMQQENPMLVIGYSAAIHVLCVYCLLLASAYSVSFGIIDDVFYFTSVPR